MIPSDTQAETVRAVVIPVRDARLTGELAVPLHAAGVVMFAHGSGSSRRSPRNQHVAAYLRHRGFATLLFDLLTPEEETRDRVSGAFRFDIDLLTRRLGDATDWLVTNPSVRGLPVAYFGASTGAAAALGAAAQQGNRVAAIVSRGGRPDLAGASLSLGSLPRSSSSESEIPSYWT